MAAASRSQTGFGLSPRLANGHWSGNAWFAPSKIGFALASAQRQADLTHLLGF
jgi:hypothetical protein